MQCCCGWRTLKFIFLTWVDWITPFVKWSGCWLRNAAYIWRRKKRESSGGKMEFQQEGFIINLLPWLLLLPWSLWVCQMIDCNWIWKFQTPSAGWENVLKSPFHGFETCTLNPQPFLSWYYFGTHNANSFSTHKMLGAVSCYWPMFILAILPYNESEIYGFLTPRCYLSICLKHAALRSVW